MTQHIPTRQLRFFLTAPSPCPYLPDREERKVFAHLPIAEGAALHDVLTHGGFRRSQTIAYRPACETCSACVSARLPVRDYAFSRSERRVLAKNGDLTGELVEAEATREQFELLRRYLDARHAGGGMSEMGWTDYLSMIEDSSVRTHLMEYRLAPVNGRPGELKACVLVDQLADGLSLVYSFYDPDLSPRSPGSFLILDHLRLCRSLGMPFLYLGYWVKGSRKMDYKSRFDPFEVLTPAGWRRLSREEIVARS